MPAFSTKNCDRPKAALSKTLVLLDSPVFGGKEKLVLESYLYSQKNNLGMTFLLSGGKKIEKKFPRSKNLFRRKRKSPIDTTLLAEISKIIRGRKIHLIHAHGLNEGIHALLAGRRFKTKVAVTYHSHGFDDSWKDKIAKKILLGQADLNIFVCRGLLNHYSKSNHIKNPAVIYNGIGKTSSKHHGKFRRSLGLSQKHLLVGMVGNFNSRARDQLTVCKAFKKVLGQKPAARLALVGRIPQNKKGAYSDCLLYCQRENLPGKIFFTGERDDIETVLADLDIFVYSSNYNATSIAILEAMSARIPIISSHFPTLEEITPGKTILKFKHKRPSELAEKILYLASNRAKAAEMAEGAKEYFKNNFTIEKHLKKLAREYFICLSKDRIK